MQFEPTAIPDVVLIRSAGVRRRTRVLSRVVERAALRGGRAGAAFRPGQPQPLQARHASRSALSGGSATGKARARGVGCGLRRRGRPAAELCHLRALGRRRRLSDENQHMLWIPPGFAHGFLVLSESADFIYKCTDFYAPEHERSIRWDDAALGIAWPLPAGAEPLLSAKDRAASRIPRRRVLLSHAGADRRCRRTGRTRARRSRAAVGRSCTHSGMQSSTSPTKPPSAHGSVRLRPTRSSMPPRIRQSIGPRRA